MIAIVGAGIIGLSIAWYLARNGEKTVVFERGVAGRGATWASAGMLAPNLEAEPGEENQLPLLLEGRKMWEKYVKELEEQSQTTVNYRREGTLAVALTRDDVERLRFLYKFQRESGLDVEMLDGERVLEMEPNLNGSVLAALYSRSDHQVDNRLVISALKKAYLRCGGVLKEGYEVDKIVTEGGKVSGLSVAGGFERADYVILAAGAWSRNMGGIPEHLKPPVRPVKGQMISVRTPHNNPILRHTVWGPFRNWGPSYIVPRLDGRLLLGTTVEEAGFDTSVTAGGLMNILRACWEILPGITDFVVDEVWAGLRPGSRDDAPIIGPTPIEGLLMATGHFRNGILLAPITAEAISRYILSGEMLEVVRPFTIDRFIKGG
ncbi:MAG: glycine oxidase ThiO [Candidatus Caldarchaeum sp.]